MDKRFFIFILITSLCLFLVNQWFAPPVKVPEVTIETTSVPSETPPSTISKTMEYNPGEEFYVLENDYQQLVFSNLGGSLAELNLPFQTKENTKSIVKEIDFDKMIQKDYPKSDYFPARSYYVFDTTSNSSKKVTQVDIGGYYPLLRRSTFDDPAIQIPPSHYALNLVTDSSTFETPIFKVRRFEKNLIEFEGKISGKTIIKTFSFPEDPSKAPYCINLKITTSGESSATLHVTSGIPEVELTSGNFSPILKYRTAKGNDYTVKKLSLPKDHNSFNNIEPDWICNSNGFFGLVLDPINITTNGISCYKIAGEDVPTRLSIIESKRERYPLSKYPGYEIQIPLKSGEQTQEFRFFAGPFQTSLLKLLDTTFTDPKTGEDPDYMTCQSFHGWFSFISEPFAKILFLLMAIFHKITGSWGISIILLTIALRVMLYPLNSWAAKSQSKMQEISPLVTKIQERYKKDPKRGQIEVMKLYKEKGVNPFTGCIPLLIQMPFLIGMFDLLKSSFELRGASFIPGWIDNLTSPDVLFSWNFVIPVIGNEFHLLPIISGVFMFLQQKLTSNLPKDVKLMTDQQRQQKFMGNILVIFFTIISYNFPSGLNLYWLCSNILGIVQQLYTSKKKKK